MVVFKCCVLYCVFSVVLRQAAAVERRSCGVHDCLIHSLCNSVFLRRIRDRGGMLYTVCFVHFFGVACQVLFCIISMYFACFWLRSFVEVQQDIVEVICRSKRDQTSWGLVAFLEERDNEVSGVGVYAGHKVLVALP